MAAVCCVPLHQPSQRPENKPPSPPLHMGTRAPKRTNPCSRFSPKDCAHMPTCTAPHSVTLYPSFQLLWLLSTKQKWRYSPSQGRLIFMSDPHNNTPNYVNNFQNVCTSVPAFTRKTTLLMGRRVLTPVYRLCGSNTKKGATCV